ncbi:MAG TPA: hypothetical protein VD996_15360 [Chitinophagaceae bacterium]|nr:hypothetical protein [Chitinophagaceae bacterium]
MAKPILVLAAFVMILSCAKNAKHDEEQISLQSPDGTIKLASSITDLLTAASASNKQVKDIVRIDYPHCSRGYYAVVTYIAQNGKESTIVYSKFPLATVSSSTTIHKNDGQGDLYNTAPACYEYWCTTAGNCTTCGVRVSDPFGNPTLSCSCNDCHLHQKKYDCPQ